MGRLELLQGVVDEFNADPFYITDDGVEHPVEWELLDSQYNEMAGELLSTHHRGEDLRGQDFFEFNLFAADKVIQL
eukprot:SAG22_NODE_2051_length_3077_cov_41.063465_3_plen_76_part_00